MLNTMPFAPPTIEELLTSPFSKFITFAANDCGYSGSFTKTFVTAVHPFFLKAKSEASKQDNPNWHQAMNRPFADEYWKAAEKEIITLEGMGAWDVVEHNMNVMNGTWAFKCKLFPNGTVKKFKACFCVCGDQQLEGIDFFETYAPVVQWTTVCLMLILENLLGLKSNQADVTAAFLHATLGEDEKVYVEMPLGFKQCSSNRKYKVLCLKKTLYGLHQSSHAY